MAVAITLQYITLIEDSKLDKEKRKMEEDCIDSFSSWEIVYLNVPRPIQCLCANDFTDQGLASSISSKRDESP